MGLFGHAGHARGPAARRRRRRRRRARRQASGGGIFRKVSVWFENKPVLSRIVMFTLLAPIPGAFVALSLATNADRSIRAGLPAGAVAAGMLGEAGVFISLAGLLTAQPEIVAAGAAIRTGAALLASGRMSSAQALELTQDAAALLGAPEVASAEAWLQDLDPESYEDVLAASELAQGMTGDSIFSTLSGGARASRSGFGSIFSNPVGSISAPQTTPQIQRATEGLGSLFGARTR